MPFFKKYPQSIDIALDDFFDSFSNKKAIKRALAIQNWEKVVGNVIANHTESIRSKQSILYVKMDEQVWRHEVQASSYQILKKLNESVSEDIFSKMIIR